METVTEIIPIHFNHVFDCLDQLTTQNPTFDDTTYETQMTKFF